MVYPKHLALPPSPRKKAKTSLTVNDFKTATTTTAAAASSLSYQAGEFAVTSKMSGKYNSMIATNASTIKKIEEKHVKSTALLNEKFDVLLHYVKRLDQRLAGIEDQTKANTEDNVELIRAVVTVVDTADILEIRLGSIGSRVSSIERIIIR